MPRCCQWVKSPTNNTLIAVGAEKRNVCFVGVSICLAIHHGPFQNSGFLLGIGGHTKAHQRLLALHLEFNQRAAKFMLFPIPERLPCLGPLSSEKVVGLLNRSSQVQGTPGLPRFYAWSEAEFFINYLPIWHEDLVD
jgi:hypothetical protein